MKYLKVAALTFILVWMWLLSSQAQWPESSLGTYPVPPIVGMAGRVCP